MKKFKYVAIDPKTDQVIRKETSANSKQEVESLIGSKKLNIVLIREVKGEKTIRSIIGGSVSKLEKINLTNELSIMLKAGIPIGDSLDIIKEGQKNGYLIEIIEGIKYSVQSGSTLSESFKLYPDVFDSIFTSTIEAGESSGKLAKALSTISEEIKRDYRLSKDVTGALIYPAVIISTLIIIGLSMFIFVVPKIATVYDSLAVQIPLTTRIFLAIGLFFSRFWWLALFIIIVLGGLIWWGSRKKEGQRILGSISRRLPVLKYIFLLYNYVRFCRVLSIMLKSGVQINESVELASKGFSDPKLSEAGKQMAKELEEGITLAEAMGKHDAFPVTMVKMIEVGEKTGKLDRILNDLSQYYSEELTDRLSRFASLIEPILVVIIGFGIGAMVISLIGPIYGLISQLQV